MELMDYRKDFIEEVKSTALSDGEGTVSTFVKIAGELLEQIDVLPHFELSFYKGVGKHNRKMRVDGYSLDEFEWTMNLVVADYRGGEETETLIRTEANQFFDRALVFLEEAMNEKLHQEIEISTPAHDLVDLLRANKEKIRKIRILLLSDAVISNRIDSLPPGEFHGLTVEYSIWDISRFYKVLSSDQGREALEINFLDFMDKGIPCLEASHSTNETNRIFLCVIPGKVLADIYDRYGGRLLEGNVRSFLSTKVAVNKKIRETIRTKPSMFIAFNNGIAATATDVVIERNLTGNYITYAKDLQIVNGGQTTASLSTARFKDGAELDQIYVQMKLTEVDVEMADSIIPEISKSSNSQNKVSEADFFSNHPFHIRIEQFSRRLFANAIDGAQRDTHWFYERARGQYIQSQMKMTKNEKMKFELQNPKKQLITKTDLAKFQNSWLCFPHIVSRGAQTNFVHFAEWITEEWEENSDQFNELYFKETVALAILFKHIEDLVTRQSWYEKGYRANIVTYSIALLSHLIKKTYGGDHTLDLQMIWNKQSVPDALNKQMVLLTKSVFEVITSDDRETVNVTQWCKREPCWNSVKQLKITLLPEINSVLVDKQMIKKSMREAKKDQRLLNGIDAQMFVLNLGSDYWYKMLTWALQKNLLSNDDAILLKLASNISSKRMPNPSQCQKLQEIREVLISEGFVG